MLEIICVAATLVVAAASEPSDPAVSDPAPFETVVRADSVDDGLDAQRRLDAKSPGFATAIELDHEAGSRSADALPEVLARSTGITVRSLGGLGQYSALSLRGSSAQQVAVFVDGVPLGTSVGGLVDLSDLPLDALERVEVYRGYVPIAFGSAAIGGVINLVGKRHSGPPKVTVGIGGGSHGGREARLAASTKVFGDDTLALQLGYGTAAGDFKYLDVNGTPSVRERHTMSRRTNNGFDRLLGQVSFQGRRGDWRLRVQERVLSKHQGIPGPARLQSTQSSLDTLSLQSIVNLSRTSFLGPGGRFELAFGVGFERRRFKDPLGEVGIAIDDEQSDVTDTFLSPRIRVPLWREAFFDAVLDVRHEWTGLDNRMRLNPQGQLTSGDASRQRLSTGGGVEVEQFLFGRRLLIAPALRIERVQSYFAVPPGEGEFSDEGRDFVLWGYAPRLGVRYQILDGLEIRASGGRYFRPPNLMELFGDRGFVIGNEGLTPEQGSSVDAGVVVDTGRDQAFGVYWQVAGFATKAKDLIHWQQTGAVLRSENISSATIAGVETGLSAWLWRDLVRLQGNYTYLHTRNESPSEHTHGQSLTGRPEHEVFARVSAGGSQRLLGALIDPRIFYTFEMVAGTFLDPSGRRLVPARALHGVGVEIAVQEQVHFSFEARNLLDKRTTTWTHPSENIGTLYVPLSDFIGYPLPGRSFWLNLTGTFDGA